MPFKPIASGANYSSWFPHSYARDIKIAAGEQAAVLSNGSELVNFTRMESAESHNQLLLKLEWLRDRYEQLGIETAQQRYMWRHIEEGTLMARLPRAATGCTCEDRPILLIDHIDTAFEKNVFNVTGQRISTPGTISLR